MLKSIGKQSGESVEFVLAGATSSEHFLIFDYFSCFMDADRRAGSQGGSKRL